MRNLRIALGALTTVALLGCNMLTGADELVVDDDQAEDGNEGGGDDGAGASGAGTNNGGAGSGASTGEGAGDPVGEQEVAAEGYSIREVAFYQAVKSTVFSNGAAHPPTVSLVADRPAVVRVFVDTSSPSGAPVVARLTIGNNPPLEQAVSGSISSNDEDYESTINFDVPASYMTPSTSVQVQLLESNDTSSGTNTSAVTPSSSLTVQLSHRLKVTIVPVVYQADGSNRMPDVSQSQLDRYRAYFMALYPTSDVVVQLGQSLNWSQGIDADGNGWDTLLNAVSERRTAAAAASFDEFYYGVFSPASSFNTFCAQGCVAGLGFIGETNGEYSRAAIGLGYSGDSAAWTAVHEVGHNHGRPHSPCGGVAGADPGYPHSGGNIGVWGMEIFGHQMVAPNFKDFMGYCEPAWISDYVYEEILDFMQSTGGQQNQLSYVPEEDRNQMYERVSVGGANADNATFLDSVELARPPSGEAKNVTITDEDGSTRTVQGSFFAYDHLPGGVLFVKRQPRAIRALDLSIEIGGASRVLRASR